MLRLVLLSIFLATCLNAISLTNSALGQGQIAPNPNPSGNTISLNNGSTWFNDEHFDNNGVIENFDTLFNSKQINNVGEIKNFGILSSDEGVIINNVGTISNFGEFTSGTLNNDGTINVSDGTFSFDTLDNNGILSVSSGELDSIGELNNFSTITNSGTLKINNLTNNGTLANLGDFESSGTLINATDYLLENGGTLTNNANLTNHGTLNNANGGLFEHSQGTLTNNGTLTNDETLTSFDYIENNGTLNNKNGSLLENFFEFTNNGTLTNDGTLDSNFSFQNNGTLNGDGIITGELTDEGILAPGNSAGVLTFTGSLTKTAGQLDIELGGVFDGGDDKSLTEFDWLDINGDLELAGALDVQLINNFSLDGLYTFEIINLGGTLTGQFDNLVEGAVVGNFQGVDLFITYTGGDGNDIVLYNNSTAVPEPTSTALLIFGLGLFATRRRSRVCL